MMLSNKPWSMLRYGLVFVTWGVVTWDYYSFSRFVHKPHHFGPPHGQPDHFKPPDWFPRLLDEDDRHHDEDDHHHGHEQGRKGSFDRIHLKKDALFLYGLALPLALLTLASLIWNPSTSTKGTATKKGFLASSSSVQNSRGEVNVQKWTIIWFVLPLLFVMFDAARGHHIMSRSQGEKMGWNLYVRICMSLMSPSGYAATWALALFLIPVTKHSPILDWLRVTPVQALAFHRVAGWTSFWNSVLHGFLHLRHLMDVLNPGHLRPWYQQLKILLIPSSWKCIGTQNPWDVFWGRQDPLEGASEEEARQCWLALVNATGMISVLAFVILAITSLPQVRRYSYALFYIVHIPMAWIMLIMAIWHYPTCALVLIPNIIYYLSFNVPVYVTQTMDYWSLQRQSKKSGKAKSSPLVEANLIEGGSIELIFATKPRDCHRHESHFAKMYHPSISPLSHPFSVFSRQDLMDTGVDDTAGHDNSSFATLSILLRPTGPFTQGLTKVLFPNHKNDETVTQESSVETNTQEGSMSPSSSIDGDAEFGSISEPLIAPSSALMSPHHMIQFDSYYAGSFDWIDRAMISHDEILLVAGGVGIVPFLDFLPSLQQRIQKDTLAASTRTATSVGGDNDESLVDSEALLEADTLFGPKLIHLHWYCREPGLASYVWCNHLCHHVQQAWGNNPSCQGRLKIHLHLTSLNPTSSSATEEAGGEEEALTTIPNSGLVEKHTYYTAGQQGTIRPAQDAHFTQSSWLSLLLPGSLMVAGTILHWWWYKQFIVNDKFRDDNLIIRSHSIVFTLILAMVVSILVEHYLQYCAKTIKGQHDILEDDSNNDLPSLATTESTTSTELQNQSKTEDTRLCFNTTTISGTEDNNPTFLKVTKGRPSVETVIGDIVKAARPGVYSCGPRPLMESVEGSICCKRADCAFYREDSEM